MDAMDPWVVAQYARICSINADIQAMIAMNQYRTSLGQTIAYGEEQFQEYSRELFSIHNLIMENR